MHQKQKQMSDDATIQKNDNHYINKNQNASMPRSPTLDDQSFERVGINSK